MTPRIIITDIIFWRKAIWVSFLTVMHYGLFFWAQCIMVIFSGCHKLWVSFLDAMHYGYLFWMP